MLFKINGERNSGTNFLENLIKQNFKNVFVDKLLKGHCYFWKHGVPNSYVKNIDNLVIDIFIFRKLDSWLMSMYKNQYHLKKKSNFEQFLTQKQHSCEIIKRGNTNNSLNHDDNNKTIFDIRYYKYTNILDYYNNNNNIIFVSLDFLKNNNNCKIFLDTINQTYNIKPNNDWIYINKHTKTNTNQKERIYDINIDTYRNIINNNKNKLIETKIDNLTYKIKKNDIIIEYNMCKNINVNVNEQPINMDNYNYLTVYEYNNKIRLGKKMTVDMLLLIILEITIVIFLQECLMKNHFQEIL